VHQILEWPPLARLSFQRSEYEVHMIWHDGDESDARSISIKVETGIKDLIALFFRKLTVIEAEGDKVGAASELPVGEMALMDGEGVGNRGRG